MSRASSAGAAALLLLVSAPGARAGILFFNTFKVQYFTQGSNSQPVTPIGYAGFANINASLSTDLTGGSVTSSSPLSPMALTGSGGNYAFGQNFATKATLDADFPNSNTPYLFHVTGGTDNGQSATLTTPASDEYASAIPYFAGSVYSMLQGVNTAAAINLTFNSFTGAANTPLTFISIDQVSNNANAFGTSGPGTLTSATVSANTLLPGTQYDLSIVYSDRAITSNAGFGGATSFSAYDLRTDLIFTTAAAVTTPEASSFALVGLGSTLSLLIGVFRVRKRA